MEEVCLHVGRYSEGRSRRTRTPQKFDRFVDFGIHNTRQRLEINVLLLDFFGGFEPF
jgi:hypothetical protein